MGRLRGVGGGGKSLMSCQCRRCGLNSSWRVGGPVSIPSDETKSEYIQCCRETNVCVYDTDQQTVYALWLCRVLSSTLSVSVIQTSKLFMLYGCVVSCPQFFLCL